MYTSPFTPTGTGKLDNIYKIKVENNNFETTEEQIINTIARVVKALQNVDAADFEAKYNALESNSTKQTQVKDYLKEIQDQAQEIIIGSDKDVNGQSKQPTYDFSNNYHKGKFDDNGNWQTNATDYTQPTFNYQHFFDFLNKVIAFGHLQRCLVSWKSSRIHPDMFDTNTSNVTNYSLIILYSETFLLSFQR